MSGSRAAWSVPCSARSRRPVRPPRRAGPGGKGPAGWRRRFLGWQPPGAGPAACTLTCRGPRPVRGGRGCTAAPCRAEPGPRRERDARGTVRPRRLLSSPRRRRQDVSALSKPTTQAARRRDGVLCRKVGDFSSGLSAPASLRCPAVLGIRGAADEAARPPPRRQAREFLTEKPPHHFCVTSGGRCVTCLLQRPRCETAQRS